MSSTNKTATIGLSQYIGSDKPTYLTDYNTDMLKIDTAIATDRDDIATAKNTADGAVNKADANKDSIDTLDAQINTPAIGIAARTDYNANSINTINELLGNGRPTAGDQTVIGAINANTAAIEAITPGGAIQASNVEYDNTTSGLAADDVQEAIDEINAKIPSIPGATTEVQTGTLVAGQTSVTLTFSDQTIGSTTLVDVYNDADLPYVSRSNTSTTVTLTFEAQVADVAVAVKIEN